MDTKALEEMHVMVAAEKMTMYKAALKRDHRGMLPQATT